MLPAIDVYETDDALRSRSTCPASTPQRCGSSQRRRILIAGEKAPRRAAESSFHLVERGYGRFARVIR